MQLIVNNISWILSAAVIVFVSISLLMKIEDTQDGYEQYWQTNSQNPEINLSNCCIATTFNRDTALNAIVLGHSLHNLGINNIRIFAFSKNKDTSEKQKIIESLFNYTEYNTNNNDEKSIYNNFWIANQCKRVISVSPMGIFNKFPFEACKSTGFSAVAQLNDIIKYDSHFFALDTEDIKGNHLDILFDGKITGIYHDYNPLPTDYCVKDYFNEFLDFWSRFASPTYITYSSKTFSSALSKKFANSDRDSSIYLYPLIYKVVNEANMKYNFSILN